MQRLIREHVKFQRFVMQSLPPQVALQCIRRAGHSPKQKRAPSRSDQGRASIKNEKLQAACC
jgi:hypothetical protein